MNYYSHHIGDYLSATAHLSLLEHGAYRRMLDVYYINESPFPNDMSKVFRLVGARTKEEREAVEVCLHEFFTLDGDKWVQSRCDHEIALCNKNRMNGAKGGRPSKNGNPDGTQPKPKQKPKEEPNNNPTGNPPITPSPHHPITGFLPSNESARNTLTEPFDASPLCARLSKANIKGANPTNPRLIALLNAGVTAEEIANLAEEPASAGKSLAWVLAAVEGRRRDAANLVIPKAPPEKPPDLCVCCGKPASKRIGRSWYCITHDQFSEKVAA